MSVPMLCHPTNVVILALFSRAIQVTHAFQVVHVTWVSKDHVY